MAILHPPRTDGAPIPPLAPTAGDQLAALIQAHQAMVWRYLRLLGADAHEADDLMQDALVRFAHGQRRGEQVHSVPGFLRGIARNLLLAARRRTQRELPAVDWLDAVDRLAQADPLAFADERVDALRACLTALRGRERQAIEWHHLDGLSRRTTAERLGIGEDGIKSLLGRARQRLRHCIERRLAGEQP